jgi:glycosyltransferase involved in cell wall biosynthesis
MIKNAGIVMNLIYDYRMQESGIGRYSENILNEMNNKLCEDNFYIIINKNSKFNGIKCNSKVFSFLEQFEIPYLSFKKNYNLFHSPHFNFPIFNQGKLVLTIHDLTPLLFPDIFSRKARIYMKTMIWLSKFRADKIITVSQNTKDDLVEMFNYNPNKIKVIYNGVDSSYKLIDNKKLISEINNKYNTGENFLLYVGNIKPHKNIPVLLKALSNIDKQNKLVIVGKRDKAYDEIFDIIDQNNLKDRIIFTGFVPDEDLILLYNAAALFVYPSLYEGFGLPPLEAMACGTPVITSNVSSLPEVVGDAAITVDPHNIKELSKKINKILSNKDLQNKMIQRGIERAKQFTWDKTARETIKVYEDVLNKKLL